MNIAHCERPDRVFSSTGQSGLTSDNAKFFAPPVQSENTSRNVSGRGRTRGMAVDEVVDFRRFACKNLPVCGADGLCFSAHLAEQDALFGQTWAIYAEAFTGFERRTRREHARVMRHPRYRFSAIIQDGVVVGVLAWWDLPGFCFVEHFAISSAQRSGGLGRQAMELLKTHVARPVLVDVAPFGSERLSSRRVAFYARLGFNYCATPVTLPPYAGKTTEPSNLMAWPVVLDRAEGERVLDTIRRDVYGLHTFLPYVRAV